MNTKSFLIERLSAFADVRSDETCLMQEENLPQRIRLPTCRMKRPPVRVSETGSVPVRNNAGLALILEDEELSKSR